MRITFVCTGNTCRSPMAEYILKDLLKKENIKNVEVVSRGLYAKNGDKISENTKEVLKRRGIQTRFKAKSITDEDIEKSKYIFCMTTDHKRYLPYKNVYSFMDLAGRDVPDPYGLDITYYEKVADYLEKVCRNIVDQIIKKVKE